MSELAADCAVIEGRVLLFQVGHFTSWKCSAEMSNQTQAARLKISVKKPQEHYVRLQFYAKVSFFFSICVIRNLKVRIQDSLCNFFAYQK